MWILATCPPMAFWAKNGHSATWSYLEPVLPMGSRLVAKVGPLDAQKDPEKKMVRSFPQIKCYFRTWISRKKKRFFCVQCPAYKLHRTINKIGLLDYTLDKVSTKRDRSAHSKTLKQLSPPTLTTQWGCNISTFFEKWATEERWRWIWLNVRRWTFVQRR